MWFEPGDYAEILGLYLGDGYIARLPRTWSLRIALDQRYTTMNAEIAALLNRCFLGNRVRCDS